VSDTPQQSGCGIVNLILPLFMLGGAVLGWNVGVRFGLGFGLIGVPIGLVLSIPAMGLTLTAILGVAYLIDRVMGRDGK
jgi:hypothetical protein